MDINLLLEPLEEILQNTYFNLAPYNPNNTESYFQELLMDNLTVKLKQRIESEISLQKYVKNIVGENIGLKNKTSRYDLFIRVFSVVFELKNVGDLDITNTQQLLHYLNNSDFKYGILVNFTKSGKNIKNTYVHCKVYEKCELVTKNDKFNTSYSHYKYKCIKDFKTQTYYEVMGDNLIDESVFEIQ